MANWQSWVTSTDITAATIIHNGSDETETIDNSGKISHEVSVIATYGAATEGLEVYILRKHGSGVSDFQSIGDKPFSVGRLHITPSATHRLVFSVPSEMVGEFRVGLWNRSGASVTAVTVKYRPSI